MSGGAPDRFEELLRELRAEHQRALRRNGPEAPSGELLRPPPKGAAPSWAAYDRETCNGTVELPGVLSQPSGRATDRCASAPPSGTRVVSIVPEGDDVHRSEASEPSLESVPVRSKDRKISKIAERMTKFGKTLVDIPSEQPDMWGRRMTQKQGLAKVVTSTCFELSMSVVILVNTFCIAAESQYRGMKSGYEYGVAQGNPEPADKVWPGADDVFLGIEWFFGVLFTLELLLKIVAIPREFSKDMWSPIDFSVVAFFWVERLSSDLPFPPTLIRLARMARLLRFLRVVKTMRGFASLYLMLQSIKGSVSALGWSSAVLLLGEMMFALGLNLLLIDYWEDQDSDKFDLSDRQELYEYFGTFTRSLLTMIEMLLGNWYSITRILTRFNELFMLFGVCHQLVFGFAVIEVISGVFLNETFKVAALDDSIMLNEVRRAAKAESAKLTEFFEKADKDNSGLVDLDEFKKVLDNEQVVEWLGAMGLDIGDIDKVFLMLDADGDGQISCQELVDGASMLKKPARAVDLAALHKMLEDVHGHVTAEQR